MWAIASVRSHAAFRLIVSEVRAARSLGAHQPSKTARNPQSPCPPQSWVVQANSSTASSGLLGAPERGWVGGSSWVIATSCVTELAASPSEVSALLVCSCWVSFSCLFGERERGLESPWVSLPLPLVLRPRLFTDWPLKSSRVISPNLFRGATTCSKETLGTLGGANKISRVQGMSSSIS